MKYIVQNYSPEMLAKKNCIIYQHELSEDEFKIWADEAVSRIKSEEIANKIGVETNDTLIKIGAGDVLLIVSYNNGNKNDLVYTHMKILENLWS